MKNVGASSAQSIQRAGRTMTPAGVARRRTFIRHLLRSIFGVSFPVAGSIIVIYTLSGETRHVAVIATVIAIVGHIIHSMLELAETDRIVAEPDDGSTFRGVI